MVDGPFRLLAFVLGIAIVVSTAASVFTTLVLPRATSARMLRGILRGLRRGLAPVVGRLHTYERRDRLMALVGPLSMVALFVCWLGLMVIGFGLMTWWESGSTLVHSIAVAGSSVFTLGIATVAAHGSEVLEILAAGTGLAVVALEIAYLPTLYAAFSARESEVTLLATRAGLPGWGPEVLARHHWFGTEAELPDLYRTWERWAAGVAESHSSYPSLIWLRSPVPTRSWLVSLTAMLDAAALHDAIRPSSAPRAARICLQMGVNCLRILAAVLRIPVDDDPLPTAPIRLSYDEYLQGVERLREVGYPFERSPEEAWRHFAGWRVNYEPIVDALSRLVMPPPSPWFDIPAGMPGARLPHVLDRTPDDPQGFGNPEHEARARSPEHDGRAPVPEGDEDSALPGPGEQAGVGERAPRPDSPEG